MQTSKTRLMAISGATLALIVAGTAAVSAHPDRGDRGDQRGGKGRIGAGFRQQLGSGALRDRAFDRIGAKVDSFIRTETTFEDDDGLVTKRVDNGTVSGASDAALEYTLATGETASVSTDDDTQVVAFSEQTVEVGRRGISRERMVPEQVALADIEAGSEVVVWSESQDDGSFLAGRIVVQPVLDEDSDEMTDAATTDETEDAAVDDSAAAPATDA